MRMIDTDSIEDLRKELELVNKEISNSRAKVNILSKYRKDITSRIKVLASRNTKTLDITKFTGDDPILEVMNTLKDSDEIVIDDVAYMFGITR